MEKEDKKDKKEEKFSSLHLDILKEIGTVGAGRAATALSELLKSKVDITLPESKILPIEGLGKALGNPEEAYFVLDIGLEGEINGRFFFLLPVKQAKILATTLLGKPLPEIDINDPLFQSSLKEIANILSGSYMNAVSEMTGLTIMYGIPYLAVDMVSALLDFFFIQIAQYSEEAIFVRTKIKVENIHFGGLILFFPDYQSLRKIIDIIEGKILGIR